jgi:hypothetical protein
VGVIEQGVPCRQSGDHSPGGGMVDVHRQRRKVARLDRDVLRKRPVCGSGRPARTLAGRRSGRWSHRPARRRRPTPGARARSASGPSRRDQSTSPARPAPRA